MAALRKIYQSITYKKGNHVMIMMTLVALLLVSFYAFFSITDRTNSVGDRVSRNGGSHTSIFVDKESFRLDASDRKAWGQLFKTHSDFVERYLDDREDVSYRYVSFIPNQWSGFGYAISGDLYYVAHDPEGGTFTLIEGKPLDDLGLHEVAVTKEYADYLRSRDIEPIGYTFSESLSAHTYDIRTGRLESDGGAVTLSVASVIDYPNYELSFSPIKDLQDVELFQEINSIPAIASQETIDSLFTQVATNTEWYDHDVKNTATIMRLYYKHYTPKLEAEIVQDIINASSSEDYNIVYSNIHNIETFEELISRNPITESLLTVVIQFVVGGVLVSSLYALYIQFKNQINENMQTLALYTLTGVKRANILKAYFLEIILVCSSGFVLSLLAVLSLSQFLEPFRWSVYVANRVALITVLLVAILFGMVYWQLRSIFKQGLSKTKVGSGYQFRIAKTTSKNLVRNLTWIQTLKHLPINIGMAFSLALTVCILILTISASLIMTNLYQEDTFGVKFDYMIPGGNAQIYRRIYPMTENQTFVSKSRRVFTDYDLWEGASDYYKSSVITFHNFLEPYVDLVDGAYPINYSSPEYALLELGRKEEYMVSRRHFDKRGLKLADKPGGRLEDGFIFQTYGFNLSGNPENIRGSRVTGSLNVLLDRGWTAFETLPTRDIYLDQEQAYSEPEYQNMDILLFLDENTSPESFVSLMESEGIDYLSYDHILNQFNEINKSMNAKAIETSLSVAVLLIVLTILSMIAIVRHMRSSRHQDFKLYNQIGITQQTLTRMQRLESIIRAIVTLGALLGLYAILYPLMASQLKKAFGLYTLPHQYYWHILGIMGILLLVGMFVLVIYQRKGSESHVKNQ